MTAMNKKYGLVIAVAVLFCILSNKRLSSVPNLGVTEIKQRKASIVERVENVEMIQSAELGLDTTFIYGIFSMRSEKEERRRQLIRDTYLQDPRFCPLNDLIAPNASTPPSCFVYYTFVIAGGGDNDPTDHGNDSLPIVLEPSADEKHYGDVVVLNIKENMEHGKSQTWFKYAASLAFEGHRINYVGKMDSDTLPNVDDFVGLIKRDLPPAPFNRRIYGGSMGGDWRRDGLYGFGQFYFMSTDLAHYISKELTVENRSEFLEGKKIEDTDIAHLVHTHRLPVRNVDLRSFLFWKHPLKTEEQWLAAFNGGVKTKYLGKYLPVWNYCRFKGYKRLEAE